MTTSTPYITQQGLEDRFGREFLLRVTDPTGTGEVDQGKVTRAISDATELVNSYLGKRYTVQLYQQVFHLRYEFNGKALAEFKTVVHDVGGYVTNSRVVTIRRQA